MYKIELNEKSAVKISVKNKKQAVYHGLSKLIDGADLNIKSKTWNDKKITGHHGLIPTMHKRDLSALSKDEMAIYEAIVRIYIAQFYPQ